MFGPKNPRNTLIDDISSYLNGNNFGNRGTDELFITYAALVESRLTNDLTLLGNPLLCQQLGLDLDAIAAEVRRLVEIRQKISFDNSEDRTRGSR